MNTPRITQTRQMWQILLAICLTPLIPIRSEASELTKEALCVMTYNLRYASATPPNAWPDRRPLMRECITAVSPDVIGTQEGLYAQLKDVASDLPDYDWIGLGREGGSRSEFMAVFFRKTRLEPLAFDHFWLSDTPKVIGSSTWGNSNRRMVTWVRFKDKLTGQEFYFFNTHFDHEIQLAREKSATAVREYIEGLKTDLPVILVGDFNASAKANRAYDILTEGGFFTDSWFAAAERQGEGLGTFNGFRGVPKDGSRIDWILTRGEFTVFRSGIIDFAKDGKFPSDHFPVASWLKIGK